MPDGTFPGIISANRDLNAVGNVIYVQLSDGTAGLSITGGILDVTINNASIVVTAVDLDIRDLTHVSDSIRIGDGTDLMGVNADGSINVNIVSGALSDEIHDFSTASAVAGGATSNHDYTIVNATFLLGSVIFSASGDGKFEIQIGPIASLATKAVGFTNGKQGDVRQVDFNPPIEVPVTGTGTIRVIRTNRENQPQDVYSTIIGRDIA